MNIKKLLAKAAEKKTPEVLGIDSGGHIIKSCVFETIKEVGVFMVGDPNNPGGRLPDKMQVNIVIANPDIDSPVKAVSVLGRKWPNVIEREVRINALGYKEELEKFYANKQLPMYASQLKEFIWSGIWGGSFSNREPEVVEALEVLMPNLNISDVFEKNMFSRDDVGEKIGRLYVSPEKIDVPTEIPRLTWGALDHIVEHKLFSNDAVVNKAIVRVVIETIERELGKEPQKHQKSQRNLTV